MNNYTRDNENKGRGVVDILRLDPNIPSDWEIIKNEYRAVDIDKVVIDGDTFTNYGDFQFVWEKSYVTSPTRSNSGAIDNLNSYATFVTPHLILNFSIMSIDDYRAIMRKDLERNEFIVECYDPIYNKRISVKMYFATPQMAKLYTIAKTRLNGEAWEDFVEIVGVHGYTVELIGTNSDIEKVSVIYYLNAPINTNTNMPYVPDNALSSYAEEDVYNGQEIVIGNAATSIVNETFGGALRFTKWNISRDNPLESKTQGNYINGNTMTVGEHGIKLYAQWENSEDRTLSFNYGLADPSIAESTYTYETSRKVVQGKSIGTLPTAETPTVKAKDLNGEERTYTPYYNGAWYKTPVKAENSVAVKSGDLYWLDRDSTIYLLYDTIPYALNLWLDGDLYQTNSLAYNSPMNLPLLVKKGYKFDGWYYTSDFQKDTKASGLMPPYNLALYGRWVAEE